MEHHIDKKTCAVYLRLSLYLWLTFFFSLLFNEKAILLLLMSYFLKSQEHAKKGLKTSEPLSHSNCLSL